MRHVSSLRSLAWLFALLNSACADGETTSAPGSDSQHAAQTGEVADRDCALPETAIEVVRAGDRVLAAGPNRWTLFDTRTLEAIADGPIPEDSWDVSRPMTTGSVAMAGTVGLVPTIVEDGGMIVRQGIFVIDTRSGLLRTHLADEGTLTRVGLASDGSYVWGQQDRELTLWWPDSTLITRVSDVPPNARIYAAPGQLRLLTGAEEWIVDLRTQDVRAISSPTPGPRGKRDWFEDGSHFSEVSTSGRHVRIFDAEHAFVQDVGPFENFQYLGGNRSLFWGTSKDRWRAYRLGAPLSTGGLPELVLELAGVSTSMVSSGGILLSVAEQPRLRMVALHGAEPIVRDFELHGPADEEHSAVSAFSMDEGGKWALVRRSQIVVSDMNPTTPVNALGCMRTLHEPANGDSSRRTPAMASPSQHQQVR